MRMILSSMGTSSSDYSPSALDSVEDVQREVQYGVDVKGVTQVC